MRFHADLHVHSKYSRATSRDLDLEHLAAWAARKGIAVVGTGDFTHPAWCAELKAKLVAAEPGLYRLREDIEQAVALTLPASCRAPVRFMLEVEISTIYKKGDRTRKIHHLIYAPDFATVDRMSARLARIGNIASDGRPILGLDSRDLLEITLESGSHAYLVPAHIWTPWFAALGSQSGFDSIAECYGDLADHIFAVETGLSSDPPMNWRVSFLDRYRLTSNSDAHSPGKLGREATTFDCEIDYFAIKHALASGDGYVGTVEFFPDEGKYHLDGHRKCEMRLSPKETLAHGGRCPVCGEPVTIGVEHRVEMLADRSEAQAGPPATAGDVSNLVPLPEILSELTASGPASRAVERGYDQAIAKLGPELAILQSVPVDDIERAGSPLLAEAITRLRGGQVICDAGYDGEYGVIRLFEDGELKRLTAGGFLFDAPTSARPPLVAAKARTQAAQSEQAALNSSLRANERARFVDSNGMRNGDARGILAELDDDQRAAAITVEGPLLVVAGPGSGKTRMLTYRIAHLIAERGVAAENCLAITFTRRAAGEMRERLARLLPDRAAQVAIHTFHSLALAILREHAGAAGLDRGFRVAGEAERAALLAQTLDLTANHAERLLRAISRAKRSQSSPSAEVAAVMPAYDRALALHNWLDFDDLIARSLRALTENSSLAALYQNRFRWISVDEFQDVDEQQYRLLTLLAPATGNLCVIGDPNQAIYGFRGADAACFDRFQRDFPAAKTVRLSRNYRSTGTIVAASAQLIASREREPIAEIVRDLHERIVIQIAPTERAEAESVVKEIEHRIGGHSFFSIDSGRATGAERNLSFADFAVLYRTEAQSAALCEALDRSGIPYKKGSHAALADDPAVGALLQQLGDDTAGPLPNALRAAAQQMEQSAVSGASFGPAAQRLMKLAESCGNDRARLHDAVALATDAEFWDARADRVSLLTLHAAKGLEFRVVFIVGLEDGLLPLYWSEPDETALAEERRLFYVGMTRAKERLILSRARQRQWRGQRRALDPSPFLRDIEMELLKHHDSPPPRGRPRDRQLKLL